jgi:hypothetical protein
MQELKTAINNRYIINTDGVVISLKTHKPIYSRLCNKGYRIVSLYLPEHTDSKSGLKSFRVHRLVAMFYIKDFDVNLQINHKDGNKTNNNITNLEMVSCRENILHGWRILDSSYRKIKLNNRRLPNGKFGKTKNTNEYIRN